MTFWAFKKKLTKNALVKNGTRTVMLCPPPLPHLGTQPVLIMDAPFVCKFKLYALKKSRSEIKSASIMTSSVDLHACTQKYYPVFLRAN